MGKKFVIRGNYNEILSDDIGEGTVISGWTFIGKNVKIGKNCRLSNYVNIDYGSVVGDNTSIQSFSILNNNTIVGDNVLISVHVVTTDEKYLTPYTDTITRKPVVIGDNVLVGGGVRLCSVTIGKNAVIGIGAVVLNDVPEGEVWVGVPAKPLKINGKTMTREDFEQKKDSYQKIIRR